MNRFTLRSRIAIFVLVFGAFASPVRLAIRTIRDPSSDHAPFLSELDRGLADIVQVVPPRARIGWLPGTTSVGLRPDQLLYFVQYAVAPRVVTTAADADWLLIGPGAPALSASNDIASHALVAASELGFHLYRWTPPTR
jgi:hypothetical protein